VRQLIEIEPKTKSLSSDLARLCNSESSSAKRIGKREPGRNRPDERSSHTVTHRALCDAMTNIEEKILQVNRQIEKITLSNWPVFLNRKPGLP